GWFAGLKIRRRIAVGFAASLGLLVVIAVAANVGIKRGEQAFTTYDGIAANSRLVQQFERDLIDLRRNLLLFVERDDPRGLLGLRRLEPSLRETLAAMTGSSTDAARNALLAEIAGLLDRAFGNLGQAIDARHTLKEINGAQLEVYGPKAREALMQVIRTAARGGNFITAAEAGLVLDAFSESRVAATRFVGQGDMGMASEARGKVPVFVDMIEGLKSQLDNEELRKEAESAETFAKQYEAGILNAANAAGEMNRLIYQEMESDIAAITEKLEQVKTSQLAELQQEQAAAGAAFSVTLVTVLSMSVAALGLGILFAWLIGRSIANPVVALTEMMGALAQGDYDAAVPGLERRDEIGRMAAAVEVFKRNGAENERLRGEV